MRLYAYIFAMLPYMLIALPLILLWRLIAHRRRVRREPGARLPAVREAGIVLFSLFIAALASVTVIPDVSPARLSIVVSLPGWDGINLIPGMVIAESIKSSAQGFYGYFTVNALGNLGMFIPIGFCPPLLSAKFASWKRTLLLGFCASLFIELVQLFLPRETDVDDLIFNTLGALSGFLLWKLFVRIAPKWDARFKGTAV